MAQYPSSDPTQPGQYPPQSPYPYQTPPSPPAQAPKKRRRGCLIGGIIGAVVLLLIIGIAIAAANSGSGKATTGGSTPTSGATRPTTTSAPTQSAYKVGQSATLDQYTVTVNKVTTSHGSEFNQPQKAGDVFLLVDVSITNHTGQAQDISSLGQFTLKDATGQLINQTIDTDAPASPDGALKNGATLRGTIAWEVPASQHSFTFAFVPTLGSTDEADWSISV